MPLTDPDNLVYPSLADPGDNIPSDFGALASSTQAALSVLRAAIEDVVTPVVVTQSEFGTLGPNCTMDYFNVRRVGKILSGAMRITRTPSLEHGENGILFTVNTAFLPAAGVDYPLSVVQAGGGLLAAANGGIVRGPLSANPGAVLTFSPEGRDSAEIALSWIII